MSDIFTVEKGNLLLPHNRPEQPLELIVPSYPIVRESTWNQNAIMDDPKHTLPF
jgi:hypothetical protein